MSSIEMNDRNWLAMQYVLGELSESDRIAFEERLPTDLQLCEAVTAASRLVLTAQAASMHDDAWQSRQPSISTRQETGATAASRSWSAVIVTCAAMAMALMLVVRIPVKSPADGHVSNNSPQAAELVSLWRSGSDAGDDDSDDLDEMADAATDVAVPSWMLAAVSIEAGHVINGPTDQVQEN
jgi:anti-sigma-K factor RskA